MHNAALCLQRWWRGRCARVAYQHQQSWIKTVKAATLLQRVVRGWLTRRQITPLLNRQRREAAGAQRFAQGAREQLKRAIETLRVPDTARPELQNQLDAWREQHLVDVTSLSDAELLLRLRQQQVL